MIYSRGFFLFFSAVVKGAGGSYLVTKMSKAPVKWIPDSAWKELLQLSNQIEEFSGLPSNIAVNQKFWKTFSTSSDPYSLLEFGEEFGPSADSSAKQSK